jgi:LysR family hydrogen peroxide-inducible transcriptional activator
MKALPTLKQLRHLVAVAEHGHFGRAAQSCFVTQSTLSASIKELETALGAILIERTKRTVRLTPLGEEVIARARDVLREVEDIVDLVAAAGEPLTGILRLGVIPTVGPYLVPRVMPSLREAHPALKLYLREDQTARLLERLAAGDLDVVLLALPYHAEGVETLVIGDDPFFVACPRGHPLSTRERIAPDDLVGQDLLLLEEGHCLRDHALSACQLEPGEARKDGFQATSLHTLVQMVDSGLGLTLLPKMAVSSGVLQGTRIVVRPMEGRGISRRIGLAWRRSSTRKHEFALLGASLRDQLETSVSTKDPRAAGKNG